VTVLNGTLLRWLLPVLVGFLGASPHAWAHDLSRGSSLYVVTGPEVEVTVRLLAADFQQVLGVMDPDGDGVVSAGEAAAGRDVLAHHAQASLRVGMEEPGGVVHPCVPRFQGMEVGDARGWPPLYPFRLTFTCPREPTSLRLGFGFFAGSTLRHTNVARVELRGGHVEQVVFTPTQRDVTIRRAARPWTETLAAFVVLGVEHILLGYDHLLFLLALLLVVTRLRDVVVLVTAFTAAHSVTLAAAALGWANLPPGVVEPVIAGSIVWVAVGSGWQVARGVEPRVPRALVAGLFGLVHGFGFATALAEADLPREGLLVGLLGFNLGVETGQLAFCLVAWWVLTRLRRLGAWRQVGLALSGASGCLGGYWMVTRLLG
jgi:hydrogenase/urease accessory protein HupE